MTQDGALEPDATHRRSDPGFGPLLRGWRERRRLSQQELSLLDEVTADRLSQLAGPAGG